MAGISKFSITNKKNFKLTEEVALPQILAMCVKYDIDVDAEKDKKKKKNLESMLSNMLENVRLGYIELNKDGTITQNLQHAPGEIVKINYKEITGEQKLAMDGKDENDRYEQLYAVLGAASGLGEHAIMKLVGIDLKVAETLTILFL